MHVALPLGMADLAGRDGQVIGPSDYYPKYESKYFRFENKPKYVKIL